VQAADNAEDSDCMFEHAAAHPEIVGVVAWVPLDRPAAAAERLDALRQRPEFVGVRNLIHDRADPDWLLRPDVGEGLGVLAAAGVPFDLVTSLPRHLSHVPALSERHPELRIVVDHLGKPPIGADCAQWRALLARAAENPRVYAKVSGLYPAAGDPTRWDAGTLRPVVEHALDVFGPGRLMYGGDWPISVRYGGYHKVWAALSAIFDDLDPAARAGLLGGSATAFYRLPSDRLAALGRR
jgi:L-fuconolactonase